MQRACFAAISIRKLDRRLFSSLFEAWPSFTLRPDNAITRSRSRVHENGKEGETRLRGSVNKEVDVLIPCLLDRDPARATAVSFPLLHFLLLRRTRRSSKLAEKPREDGYN